MSAMSKSETEIEKHKKVLSKQGEAKPSTSRVNNGCYHIENLMSIKDQQQFIDMLRSQCREEPQKCKFQRCDIAVTKKKNASKEEDSKGMMMMEEEEEDETNGMQFEERDLRQLTEEQIKTLEKKNCYSLEIDTKQLYDSIKYLTTVVEEGCNTNKEKVFHAKSHFKKFIFDFFRVDGKMTDQSKVYDFTKGGSRPVVGKGKKDKIFVHMFCVCIGESIRLKYGIEEEGGVYQHEVTLKSGEAFCANSYVQNMSYQVLGIEEDSKPDGLILRDGSLLISCTKD